MSFTRKTIRVDLNAGEMLDEILDPEINYIGNEGVAVKLIFNKATGTVEPFSSDNELIIMTGSRNNSGSPSTAKDSMFTKLPLVGFFGDSFISGSFGARAMLSKTSFGGIVVQVIQGITGSAKYLWINDEHVELRDVPHIWNCTPVAVAQIDHLKNETIINAEAACLGPAGENLVQKACIV